MGAPTKHWLPAFALTLTRAFAADGDPATGAALVKDSNGQPVRSSTAECWRSSLPASGMAMPCASTGDAAADSAALDRSRSEPAMMTGATAAAAPVSSPAASTPASQAALAAVSAAGNPGYVTDSNDRVVRASQGECWHTGRWSAELATVVGCDGVLAKAVPVPAPAPSPKPQPPADSGAQAPGSEAEALTAPDAPSLPPSSPSIEPPAVEPPAVAPPALEAPGAAEPSSEAPTADQPPEPSTAEPPSAAPSAALPPPAPTAQPETVAPQAAAPRKAPETPDAPAAIPPAPTAPEPSAVAPSANADEAGAAEQRPTVPASEKVTLDTDTYFDFDKATLKPDGKRNLDGLAARLAELRLEVVIATGHADSTGTEAYNQRLSERRAAAVKRYLASKGVPADRIFTEGKGEKQPLASNATREGRAQNRRVVVEMVGSRTR